MVLPATRQLSPFAFADRVRRSFMHRKRIRLFIGFLVLTTGLFISGTALAQSTATLQGTITDSKNSVVPGATVVVRNKATASERTTQTDTDGNYQLPALPVGTYSVEVRAQGFKTQVADQVTVEVAKIAVQNF